MTPRVMCWVALIAFAGARGDKTAPAETTSAGGSSAAPAKTTTTTPPSTPTPTPTPTSTPTPPPPPPPPPPTPTPPTGDLSGVLESKPFVLTCGDKPLALPPAAAMPAAVPAERPLRHDKPIAVCQDQRSVESVCKCLVGTVARWADGLHAPATCKPVDAYKAQRVQLLEIRSQPADSEATAAGVTFALAGMHGGRWSAIDVIETAPELDLGVTPHASNDAAIDRFETRPAADATLVWIESRHETDETAMGDRTRTGEARVTVCIVPTTAARRPFCYASVPRLAWDFTEAITNPAAGCTIRRMTGYSDQLADGVLTVKLNQGKDMKPVGRFRL